MSNQFKELPSSRTWNILVGAATRALRRAGLAPKRVPGRGRSNIWEVEEGGRHKRVSIRTTQDRWFAFPPRKKATTWKTLDDVDIVIVAAVDDHDDPRNVEVYRFDAEEVRERFNASYAARINAGQTVRDDFGMWLSLDEDDRGLPASVGAGLATAYPPIATFSLEKLLAEIQSRTGRDTGRRRRRWGGRGRRAGAAHDRRSSGLGAQAYRDAFRCAHGGSQAGLPHRDLRPAYGLGETSCTGPWLDRTVTG